MKKAIIFDMDGLMIDSETVTFQAYQFVLKEMNLSMSIDFYKTLLGKTIPDIHQRFYEVYGPDFPVENLIKKTHERVEYIFKTQGVPLKKGLIELLEYLKQHHYRTIVATSSQRKRVDEILSLAHIEHYFDDSICGDEVSRGKPHPEVFLNSCHKLHVLPHEAIVLEDSEPGIQAAYDGNIDVICIPDMKMPEKYYQNMTTEIFESLNDVIDYLEKKNVS